jgi:hypothetical protein
VPTFPNVRELRGTHFLCPASKVKSLGHPTLRVSEREEKTNRENGPPAKAILGRIVADRAGHAMHTALLSRILRDKTLWEEVTLPEEEKQSDEPTARKRRRDRHLG